MKTTASERVALMMKELQLDQVAFGVVAGATKSVVNQWLSGGIKSIAAKYAYSIQRKKQYSAEWIQTGEGDVKIRRESTSTNPTISAIDELIDGADQDKLNQVLAVVSALLPKAYKPEKQKNGNLTLVPKRAGETIRDEVKESISDRLARFIRTTGRNRPSPPPPPREHSFRSCST